MDRSQQKPLETVEEPRACQRVELHEGVAGVSTTNAFPPIGSNEGPVRVRDIE